MSDQLPLGFDPSYRLAVYAEDVHEETRRVVREIGPKRFADMVGMKTIQQLDNAINARERHHMRFEIPLLAALLDPSDGMARAMMESLGRKYEREVEMTPEEKLERLEHALSSFGELGELVRKKAGVR